MFFLQLFLVFLVLAAALFAFCRVLQGVLYTEIPATLIWRAPLAAAIICVVGVLWPAFFNSMAQQNRWPINFDQMFLLQNVAETGLEFQQFIVPNELGSEIAYDRVRNERGVPEYRDSQGNKFPINPHKLTGVTTTGEKHVYEIVKDADGYLDRSSGSLRYQDASGRMVTEEFLYVGGTTKWNVAQFMLYVVGGLLLFVAWFLVFWLVLQFQWLHALGLAVPALLIWTFALNFMPAFR